MNRIALGVLASATCLFVLSGCYSKSVEKTVVPDRAVIYREDVYRARPSRDIFVQEYRSDYDPEHNPLNQSRRTIIEHY